MPVWLREVLQVGVFFTKVFLLIYVMMWIRWTLPRLRVDQLMELCWKYLTPIALFNLIGASLWVLLLHDRGVYDIIARVFTR